MGTAMNSDEKRVILIDLVEKLNRAESWTGETHVQKAVYFLGNLTDLNLGYPFILYKYGPFSFDLKAELNFLESSGILNRSETPPYGAHFSVGKYASAYKEIVSTETKKYQSDLVWVIDTFFSDNDSVSKLEKDSTALYAIKNFKGSEIELANQINNIKPHISLNEALEAVKRISSLRNRSMIRN